MQIQTFQFFQYRYFWVALLVFIAAFAVKQCRSQKAPVPATQTEQPQTSPKEQANEVAVPIESVAVLAPTNTSISFIGIHVGDDPNPRLGGF